MIKTFRANEVDYFLELILESNEQSILYHFNVNLRCKLIVESKFLMIMVYFDVEKNITD